jgi:predicted transcriptional regulator of viral defense system
MKDTYRRQLWGVAMGAYGYVTTHGAAELGVPPVELRKLAHRGFLEHIDRGLYRFVDFPASHLDRYMESVLWAGPDTVLSHDAVLALHDLAYANPATIRVTTPRRVRKTHPRRDITIVQADVPDHERTVYHQIPSTTVARALRDSRHLVMPQRLREAAETARQRDLLLADEYELVLDKLELAR